MSDATDDRNDAKPTKGGFGAFSQKYRDRWAADHPGRPGAAVADTPAASDAGAQPPAPTTES